MSIATSMRSILQELDEDGGLPYKPLIRRLTRRRSWLRTTHRVRREQRSGDLRAPTMPPWPATRNAARTTAWVRVDSKSATVRSLCAQTTVSRGRGSRLVSGSQIGRGAEVESGMERTRHPGPDAGRAAEPITAGTHSRPPGGPSVVVTLRVGRPCQRIRHMVIARPTARSVGSLA